MNKPISKISKIYIECKKAYLKNRNIQKFLQKKFRLSKSEITNISYNIQTGSYINFFKTLSKKKKEKIYKPFFDAINKYFPGKKEILDFGCGELTNSYYFFKNINNVSKFYANDISLNRLLVGKKYLKNISSAKEIKKFTIFCSSYKELPFLDNSIDLVISNHSLEPNNKYKDQILKELFRVSRKGLCLIEPHFEISGIKQKKRMKSFGYVSGLEKSLKRLNCNFFVIKKKFHLNNDNVSSIFIVKKKKILKKTPSYFIDCQSKKKLILKKNHLYSKDNFRLYPSIYEVPVFSEHSQIFLPNFNF